MTNKLIISNWKNYLNTLAEAEQILDSVDEYLGSVSEKEFSLVFCPPFVFTEEVGKILKTSHLLHQSELGAQDISVDDETALTGEISGPMLIKLGVRYVIIGHSERRWKIGESDEVVNRKLKTALRNEVAPIVCVGERERNFSVEGGSASGGKEFLKGQVLATFAGLNADEAARCLIAYEPIWAISTTPGACPDTPQSALESINIIKEALIEKFQISNNKSQTSSKSQLLNSKQLFLYGGSVSSTNAREFLSNEGFDGVLIGGASVNREEFIKILSIAANCG